MADADWYEVRNGRVVAICETIELDMAKLEEAGKWILDDPWLFRWHPNEEYALWESKKVVYNFLLAVTKKPIYIIYHTPDMSRVKVLDYRKKTVKMYDEKTFELWIMSL